MQPWMTAPGWRLYLGFSDGEPAGAAILYIWDRVGYLADCAVDLRWRRRGIHRALIDAPMRRCGRARLYGIILRRGVSLVTDVFRPRP